MQRAPRHWSTGAVLPRRCRAFVRCLALASTHLGWSPPRLCATACRQGQAARRHGEAADLRWTPHGHLWGAGRAFGAWAGWTRTWRRGAKRPHNEGGKSGGLSASLSGVACKSVLRTWCQMTEPLPVNEVSRFYCLYFKGKFYCLFWLDRIELYFLMICKKHGAAFMRAAR